MSTCVCVCAHACALVIIYQGLNAISLKHLTVQNYSYIPTHSDPSFLKTKFKDISGYFLPV